MFAAVMIIIHLGNYRGGFLEGVPKERNLLTTGDTIIRGIVYNLLGSGAIILTYQCDWEKERGGVVVGVLGGRGGVEDS